LDLCQAAVGQTLLAENFYLLRRMTDSGNRKPMLGRAQSNGRQKNFPHFLK